MEYSQPTDIHVDHGISLDNIDFQDFQKMAFIYNALDEGWQVVKKTDRYIFTKKHEGRKEVLSDDYLKKFIVKNFSLDKLIQ
uniref:Uncharacterized protein n=1 Tax=viral metagenome TaxID=1070528 RepID=A0A6C0CRY3_9ZZZZ